MVVCYDSDIKEYDRRSSELSNAALHLKQEVNNIEKKTPRLRLILRLRLIRTCSCIFACCSADTCPCNWANALFCSVCATDSWAASSSPCRSSSSLYLICLFLIFKFFILYINIKRKEGSRGYWRIIGRRRVDVYKCYKCYL